MMFVPFDFFLRNQRINFAVNIFRKGNSKSCDDLARAVYQALVQFNNISMFFLVNFQQKIQCFFKKSETYILDFIIHLK